MANKLALATIVAALSLGAICESQAAELPGQALYEAKCGGCHAIDENRVGPRHRGVVGRPIASLKDYDYSPAIKKLRGVWTPARIDQWLQGPQAVAPGTKMFFSVPDPQNRRDIIAYLASQRAISAGH